MADLTQHTTGTDIAGVISKIDLTSVGGAGIYEIHDAKAIHDVSELGLGNAVVFKGVCAYADLPTASASTVGHVYLDTATNKEYIGVKTGTDTYAWEPLGNIHSAASATHTHSATVTGTNADSAASVSGTVTEFLGEVKTGKPTINVTVGTHPGITVKTDTEKVLGDGTTVTATASSAMDSNVVTGATTKYLGISGAALNTGSTDVGTSVTPSTGTFVTEVASEDAKAIASVTGENGTALTGLGTPTTANAITGFGTHTTAKAITALSTTSINHVSSNTNVSATNTVFDEDTTASKVSASDVTATNTVLGTATTASKITASDVTATKTTLGTAFSVPNVTGNTSVTASKLSSAGSVTKNTTFVKGITPGTFTASVSNETLSFAYVSAKASGTAQAVTAVTLPTFTDVTATNTTLGKAFSIPNVTGNTSVTASKISANTSVTVPVISSNTAVTASKVTATDVTVPVVKSNATVTASKIGTTAVTVATGAAKSTANAITALGAATTAAAITAITPTTGTFVNKITTTSVDVAGPVTTTTGSAVTGVTLGKTTITYATGVKTQPALTAYTDTATGRIAYVASVSTGKVGITTTVTPTITPEEISAVTSVSASTSSPTVTAALASDVVTSVAAKSKTVSLSGTAKAQTWTQKSGTTGQPIN